MFFIILIQLIHPFIFIFIQNFNINYNIIMLMLKNHDNNIIRLNKKKEPNHFNKLILFQKLIKLFKITKENEKGKNK